ncbi:hypothetical protein OPT61_g318 [Boeremia exigua]|uniref:Uncharacterized protein n=1 Tax=Boeremia exigua TaxID=749465 RepID=A0ACC2IUB5_9PLEO|nr:hypothetical protein OPT61_g318 [Boeremia exigua]
MPRLFFTYLRLFALLTALLLFISPAISGPSYKTGEDDSKNDQKCNKRYRGNVIRVKHGESIQAAIDCARPYTRVEVEGEHREQVTITKDGISLIGKGAKLSPPSNIDTTNYCYGLVKSLPDLKNVSAGICIHGRNIKLEDEYVPALLHWGVKSVGDPVKDVSVSGFEVSDFDGENIALYGGKNTRITRNVLKRGLRYGFLTVGSKGTHASKNEVSGSGKATLENGPIAMCMDDKSSAVFSNNQLSGYFICLCTETNEGINSNNEITKCCIGNIIDPNVRNAKSLGNSITEWNPDCDPTAAAGISLLGAKNALVKGNTISIGAGLPQGGAGLFLGFEVEFNATNEGNVITKNKFGLNDADIFDDSKGKNYIFDNECDIAARGPVTSPTPAPEYCQPRGRA